MKSSIAFFSFVIHKVFLNIPSFPKQIKSVTVMFIKDHLLEKYYLPSIKMMRTNVDNHSVKTLVTKSGFQYQEFEVETEDGYII